MNISRRGEWVEAQVDDEMVMMNVSTGDYVGLNPVGARVWSYAARPIDLGEVCERLVAEFDVDAGQCRVQVEAFVKQMASHGALVIEPAEPQ